MTMNPKEAKVKARLVEVMESIFCPVGGCWCMHGGHYGYTTKAPHRRPHQSGRVPSPVGLPSSSHVRLKRAIFAPPLSY